MSTPPDASLSMQARGPYFGTLAHAPLMHEDPDGVVQGDGVLHLRYRVRPDARHRGTRVLVR
jgi:hypothetical protein